MLPINGAICGALFAATSRAVRGEFEWSEEAHKRLEGARFSRREIPDQLRVFREVFGMADAELAYKDDHDRAFRVDLPNGAELCMDDSDHRHGCNTIYFRKEVDGKEKMCRGVAELFWRGTEAVLLDAVERDDVNCQKLALTGHDYYGPLVENIARWTAFREAGLRRNVLIQGPPGCGKFVLFTSNDHTKLPEPMRRPGRIDQIIEVEAPSKELRWKLIREMAEREGVGVPEDHLPRLDQILVNKSTAHLVEALRRAKICGWDAAEVEEDSTFGTSWKDEKETQSWA